MTARYELDVTISSAKNLKNINWRHGPLKPYAVVWVDQKHKHSTHVDSEGDESPVWDEKLTIPFNDPIEESTLYIDIVHANPAEDTKPLIGSAKVKLNEVVNEVGIGHAFGDSLVLKRPSGRPHGKVDVNVCVREPPRYRAPDPYYATPYGVPPPQHYPAPPPYGGNYPYAAPPYGAPPQPSYGGGPPPYGGGQPPYSGGQPPYAGVPPPYAGGQPNYGGGQPPYGGGPPPYGGGQPPYGGGQPPYVGGGGQVPYGGGYKEEKKSKYGLGTGLAVGAAAGLLGGLAIAEGVDYVEDRIAEDAAEKVEADLGYDVDDDY